jgi:2,3-bisphosphoglycerate-dependent phosphoglycerate mutase
MPVGTTIYLVRHAHANWHEDDNRPLSPAGLEAAGLVADRLATRSIVAVYTSPSRRAVQTVEPLASRLGLRPEVMPDLRERRLPAVRPGEFDTLVRNAWSTPDIAPPGGESNVEAQGRGIAVVQAVLRRHAGSQVVLATHGNLLALVLNALDPRFGYEFWRDLSFPDVYQLVFDDARLRDVKRVWNAAENSPDTG